jgi:prepilin-type N-terminal cleavage/methylation domain-containing protein
MRKPGLGEARGVTLVELAVVLAILGAGIGAAAPLVGRAVDRYRVVGAGSDLYGALHLTRARARQTGVMHALVIDPDGRTFRVVEDPTGLARTVAGPRTLVDGVAASGNTTIRFSPKGFAVPFGTITVRGTDGEVRRLVVNILGRVRVEDGPPPR